MAYLKDIWSKCDASSCSSRAVVTLHNFRNAQLGQYCRSHGERQLRIQKADEEAQMARERAETS